MRHRIAITALAAAALIAGACADQGAGSHGLATEPGSGESPTGNDNYSTTGIATVVVGPKQRLQGGKASASSVGASASVVAGSGTLPVVIIEDGLPGLAPRGGRVTNSFVDASLHHHTLSVLYGANGGPPAAIQHYVDGALVSTNAFTWQHTTRGWVRTRSYLQTVRHGTLAGSYISTTTITGGSGGGGATMARADRITPPGALRRLVGYAAYRLAFAFAPQDASAQNLALTACRQQWLKYAAAAAVVAGLTAVIVDMPVITPLVITQFGGALALLAAAEDALLECVLANQPTPLMNNWGTTGGSGGGGAGGGGTPPADCLAGSYAAHCTTPFTL